MSQVCNIHQQKEPCDDCAIQSSSEQTPSFSPKNQGMQFAHWPEHGPQQGLKRPVDIDLVEEEEESQDFPDLDKIFDEHEMTTYERIKLMRATIALYMASTRKIRK